MRSQGEIVLTVASSGIAALLIPGGRTAHSRFCIPININEDSTCNINQGSPLAELIVKAKLIIWDEAPMMHRHCFEAVDKTFRDIMRFHNNGSLDKPFGGNVVVLGGDFRQILPVVPKGTRQYVVHSSINSSYLWDSCELLTLSTNMRLLSPTSDVEAKERKDFSDWVLQIGNGVIGSINDFDMTVDIPEDLLIQSTDDHVQTIVDTIYPSLVTNMIDPQYFRDRAILAPTNDLVDILNIICCL